MKKKESDNTMMQIQQYGLQWTIDISDPKHVVLKQGGGLAFCGVLGVHFIWGPYINVNGVYTYRKMNNNYERTKYELLGRHLFFVPGLEGMCNAKQVRWYNALHDMHKKNIFKQKQYTDNIYWYISVKNLLGEDVSQDEDFFSSFFFTEHVPVLYISYNKKQPILVIDNDIYNKLPKLWTIEDIYKLDKDYYDCYKQEYEQLWYNIAKARHTNQPVKIIVYDNTRKDYIYTEQKTPYGLTLPIVIPYEEERER